MRGCITKMNLGQGRRQVKQSGVDSMVECGRGAPSQVGGRVWGYNLKQISTPHNDSVPETPSGKKWGARVQPVATPFTEGHDNCYG